MILTRTTLQAKYGQGGAVVSLLKEIQPLMINAGSGAHRILTDGSGRFFTVTQEIEFDSLASYEEVMAKAFSDPAFGPLFERMTAMVDSGGREFLNIEE